MSSKMEEFQVDFPALNFVDFVTPVPNYEKFPPFFSQNPAYYALYQHFGLNSSLFIQLP
jgi:hypothetical protein